MKSHTLQQIDYVNAPAWSDHERLFGEKETLGLYLSGHPIHRYLKELEKFITYRVIDARPSQNKIVILSGIITSVRTILTKRGDRMAVVTLDDGSGQIDMLCFSENFQKYRELLTKDKLIIVEGEINIDEFNDNFRLLSREIFSMEQARERYAKYLRIQVSSENNEEMTTLASLLEKFRGGNCRITLDYARADAKANLRLGDAWRVRPADHLLQMLREVFSENNVEMVY